VARQRGPPMLFSRANLKFLFRGDIAAAGGVEVLVALALATGGENEMQTTRAAGALWNLAYIDGGSGGVVRGPLLSRAGDKCLGRLQARCCHALVHLASTRADLAADDTCLLLLLERLDQPEEDGWRKDSINALLGPCPRNLVAPDRWRSGAAGGRASGRARLSATDRTSFFLRSAAHQRMVVASTPSSPRRAHTAHREPAYLQVSPSAALRASQWVSLGFSTGMLYFPTKMMEARARARSGSALAIP